MHKDGLIYYCHLPTTTQANHHFQAFALCVAKYLQLQKDTKISLKLFSLIHF